MCLGPLVLARILHYISALNAPDDNAARLRLSKMIEAYENVLPTLVDKLDRDAAHCLVSRFHPDRA